MTSDTWTAIGVGITAAAAFGGFMAFILRLMIISAIKDAMLMIADRQYLTHEDLDQHKRECPARCASFNVTKTTSD